MVAGSVSGAVTALALHPMDSFVTQKMSNPGAPIRRLAGKDLTKVLGLKVLKNSAAQALGFPIFMLVSNSLNKEAALKASRIEPETAQVLIESKLVDKNAPIGKVKTFKPPTVVMRRNQVYFMHKEAMLPGIMAVGRGLSGVGKFVKGFFGLASPLKSTVKY